jgi:hypothetical protein
MFRESILNVDVGSMPPLKLRRELVVANQEAKVIRIQGIPKTITARAADIEKVLSGDDGSGRDFYQRFPGTSGYAQFSLPALTADRQRALVYVAHYCDGLCGSGVAVTLENSPSGWRVVERLTLWIS